MKHMLHCVVAFISMVVPYADATSVPSEDDLIADLRANFSKHARPVRNYTDVVYIDVGIYVLSIDGFDEINGIFSIVGGLYLTWNDYRLSWNPANYGGVDEVLLPKDEIWIPNLFIINPAQKMEAIGSDDFLCSVIDDGTIYWNPGGILKSTCTPDMTYFPFDVQTCDISIVAWDYYPAKLMLRPLRDVFFNFFKSHHMWTVQSSKIESTSMGEREGLILVEFTLKRKPQYYCLNVLLPMILLCLLNPLVFLLPVESGERVSYAVTIFLSFAVFMTVINDTMPETSEPMARLSYLIALSMAYSTILCFATILNLKLYFRDNASNIPFWVKRVYRFCKESWKSKDCYLKCRKPKVYNLAKSDKIVNEFQKYEQQKTYREVDDSLLDVKITWRNIAMLLDSVIFIGSAMFVVLFYILSVTLLAA